MKLSKGGGRGCGLLKAWLRLGDLLPRWITQIAKKFLLVGRSPQFCPTWSSLGCLCRSWHGSWLTPQSAVQEGGRQKPDVFYDLASGVRLHLFYSILLVPWVSSSSVSANCGRAWTPVDGKLGTILEAIKWGNDWYIDKMLQASGKDSRCHLSPLSPRLSPLPSPSPRQKALEPPLDRFEHSTS